MEGALFEMVIQRRTVMDSEVKPRCLLMWSTAQKDAYVVVTARALTALTALY